jgi:pSer/pThr/pTyr-binding forkhead associated (FHA) protein
MTAKLQVLEGKTRGAELALSGKTIFEIGSGRTADLVLEDPEIASVHAKIYVSNGEYSIFDVSGSGFLHNGKRSLKTTLGDGDQVQIGKHHLRLTRILAPQTSALPAAEPSASGVPTRIELQAVKGNDAGRSFDLRQKDVFIIGRGVATDITVWDIRVSRVHCRIDKDTEGFVLTDLNASNGTYVNGRKVDQTHRLKSGDEIKVGSTVLQYVQA